MSKKILFVANVAKRHILQFHVPMIKLLKENGWTVDVACSENDPVPFCDNRFVMEYKRSPISLKTIPGIKHLKKIIKENGYDVIYCHTPTGGLAGRLAAKNSGARVVYFAHGFHFYRGAPLVNRILYYNIEKYLSRYTDTIITLNEEDFENAKTKLRCPDVRLVHGPGADLSVFSCEEPKALKESYRKEFGIPSDAFVMIYLAELSKNKNQKTLLFALKEILKKDPNVYLLLAGNDVNHGKDKKLAEKLGIENNVRFLGWRSDKTRLYYAANLCTASSLREGLGLNVVEAMACGLIAVASDNRGHREIIKDGINGFLFSPKDSRGAAEKILIAKDLIESGKAESIYKNYDIGKFDEKSVLPEILKILSEEKSPKE